MRSPDFLYGLDEHPPLSLALVYGLQWAFLIFPAVAIAVRLCGQSLGLDAREEVRFLQLVLVASGLFTAVQTLWGHRYPLLEGPASALLLTFTLIAPYGLRAVQGGLVFGSVLLMAAVLSGRLDRLLNLFTSNVVGVILMLIALGLLPFLLNFMTGKEGEASPGDLFTFLISLGLVFLMATLSHRLKGFYQTVALLLGMMAGTAVFALLGRLNWGPLWSAAWISTPSPWIPSLPGARGSACIAFAAAYLAVMVNSLGSIQGIANITDRERLPRSIRRGLLVNGLSGIFCGLTGVVGTVSYSTSPGIVLANRVASRYVITYCGLTLLAAAFVPKLAALLAMIPPPVVGSTLCVAMGAQIGVGINIVAGRPLASRDYFVVGLPVLLGTMSGFLPGELLEPLPGSLRIFLGNGLITGIFLVLLLEHVLLRGPSSSEEKKP